MIFIIPFEIKASAGNDVTICLGRYVELGRPQEAGLDCWWYNLGNSIHLVVKVILILSQPKQESLVLLKKWIIVKLVMILLMSQ